MIKEMRFGGGVTVNKQRKIFTFVIIFLLVAESAPFSMVSSADLSSKSIVDSGSSTFGNTAIGTYSDQNDPNAKSASYFTCGSNGQVTDIYSYIARAYSTGTARAAIYADDSGQAGALIAQSPALSVTTTFSWVDFQLSTPVDVTSGSVYWLSICSDESLNLRIVLNSGVRAHNVNAYNNGFSDPFGPVWGTDPTGALSIYASVNPGSSEFSATISPTSASIPLGGQQQFTSTVTGGSSPYSYQWYINDTAVSGGTNQNFNFNPTQAGTYKIYLNVIDNLNNQAQSNIANNIIVYSQSPTNSLIPDWSNVTQDFFTLVPGAVNPVLTAANVTDRKANFVADPFIFHEGSSWYMFFEVETDSGQEIGVATSSDGFSWTYKQIVITDPSSYLSYPYVFKWEGIYYMIPNSFPLGVTLYKATNFPYSWTLVDTLISNQNFIPADASIFRYNNEWWMFTGTDSDLRLFYSYNLTNPDSWHEHPMSPLITNDSSKVRGGGRVTVFDSDKIIRLAQKGDVAYGEADRAFQVDALNETYYAEHEIPESPLISASGSGWNSWAMHTIDPWWNGTNWIVAVDGGGDYWWSIGIYVTPRPPVAISPTQVGISLGQFQKFSSSISLENAPYTFQWYQNDAAVLGATSQSWTFTPTSTGNYKIYLKVTDSLNNQFQSNIANVAVNPPSFNFSIMQITDTQTLNSAYLPNNPHLYSQLTNWIVSNSGTYNLKMVVHTGDIINEYWDASQWQDANTGMSVLANNGVPYVWCAGNHDQTTDDGWSGNPNSGWVGDQYSAFNPSSFSNKNYWAGDIFEGKNTAAKFSVGNYNFLVIDIEAFANDSTLNWMRGLLNTYSSLNYNIIVATHVYLASPNGDFANSIGDGTWEVKLQNLLNEYPKVFMTLNGHCGGDPAVNVHNQVNGRTQIEYDRQETDNLQGADSVRIYSFDLNSQTVTVSTYSVWDDLWITDSGDSFSFSPNLTSIPTVSITPTNVRMGLGKSQNFSASVSGGKLPYSYQWYLNNSAVAGATTQNWAFTPFMIGHYKVYLNVTDARGVRVQSNIVTDITVYDQSIFNFSIMQITDTQFLASTYPNLDNQLSTWIVNNNATYNLKMVVDTGDLTDQYYNGSQWRNANASMTILMNNGIPYTWCAGNHDQNGFSDPNSGWVGNQYVAFNPATFQGNSYWVSDSIQGKSTAVKFSANGYNFLIINLESQANATTIAWMTNLLNTYSSQGYNIIVATHAYLDSPSMTFDNGLPGSPTWEQNLQTLLNKYTNVFMTLNGHTDVDPTMDVHNVVNGREQIEFDRQTTENQKGACSVRIYSFDLNNQKVEVSTYSVWDSTWLTESQDAFSFSTTLTSTPIVSVTPTNVGLDLGQSQIFSSSVSGGASPYSYQWCLNDTAISGATSQNWTFTPNSTGNYKVYVNVTDGRGTITRSNVVTQIIVYPKLTTSISPSSTNMKIGETRQFNSTSSGGSTPYTYQWYYSNGTAIANATLSNLQFKANSTGIYNIYLNVTDSLNFKTQSNVIAINVYSQPTIAISPTSVKMTVQTTQQLNSTVTGGLMPYSYQWFLNGTIVPGAIDSTWNFTPATAGNYKVYLNVTDTLNFNVQSNTANITVYERLNVTIIPNNLNMTNGTSRTFSSTTTGGAIPYSYQWYMNNSAVTGATGQNWTFTPPSIGTYNIYLNVTDTNSVIAKSNIAFAIVETSLIVSIIPIHLKMNLGQNQTFISSVSGGTIPYQYQWYLNDTAVAGANSSNWTFVPITAGNFRVYLNVTDALNLKTQSNIVTDITVYPQLAVSISPTSMNMTVGTPQTFTSIISGGAQPYTYQWVLNGTPVTGANSSTWNFTPTQIGNYTVYLKVTDSLGNQAQSNVNNEHSGFFSVVLDHSGKWWK